MNNGSITSRRPCKTNTSELTTKTRNTWSGRGRKGTALSLSSKHPIPGTEQFLIEKKKPFGIETANQTIFQIFYRSCLILGTFMRRDPGLNYYWDSIYLATPSHLKTAASPPISSRTIQWVVRSWGMWQSGDMAVSQMKETLTLELKKPRKYRQFVSLQGNLSYIFCLIYLDSWLALTKVHEDMHGASNTARRQFSHEYRILRAWPLDHRGTTSTYTSIEQNAKLREIQCTSHIEESHTIHDYLE